MTTAIGSSPNTRRTLVVLVASAVALVVALIVWFVSSDGSSTEVRTQPAGSQTDEPSTPAASETSPPEGPATEEAPAVAPDSSAGDAGTGNVSSPEASTSGGETAEDYWTEERMDDAEPAMPTPGPADAETGPQPSSGGTTSPGGGTGGQGPSSP